MKYEPGMTKNDINSTWNVTSIIVMYTFVNKKSVMSAIKSTTIYKMKLCDHEHMQLQIGYVKYKQFLMVHHSVQNIWIRRLYIFHFKWCTLCKGRR